MILSSTLRRLHAQNADVFAVTVPAYTLKKGALCADPRFPSPDRDTECPEYRQHFATKAQAVQNARALTVPGGAAVGIPEPVISTVPAKSLDLHFCF